MKLRFSGEVYEWRGPAPFHFVTVPEDCCLQIATVAPLVSYGWGMIPVSVRIGATEFSTALWPRHGAYVVPIKDRVRAAESIELGDTVAIRLSIDTTKGPLL